MNTPRNPPKIAYCTNVHAGASWAETRANLDRHATEVRRRFSPTEPMGVGLWLSARTAESLATGPAIDEFSAWLDEVGLVPFTFNGFPYGDFHQPVVKHKVYEPTWFDRARLDYTQNLVRILHRLAPPRWQGSISTLPLAWREPPPTAASLDVAARLMRELATSLAELESETGRLIYLCVEPEPGCHIQRGQDLIGFFQRHLLPGGDERILRRHIRACHDVCHAVVMCESQESVLAGFRGAGIEVGKVQISSAVVVEFDRLDAGQRAAAHAQLASFAEDRYLHQTTIQHGDQDPEFFDDLPAALRSIADPSQASGTWRVHFHVPVFLGEFGLLKTSQTAIMDCLRACADATVDHFEVETYAWNVLPAELREEDLASGIAREMHWFSQRVAEILA